MSFDEYFSHDDKPFAENLNDALLLSNVFDMTVPIQLPAMFSNQTWTDTTSERKAGVSIVQLAEELPNTLSISTQNSQSVITGTGTMKLLFYPNFNSFGQFKAFNWTSSNNKIQVNLKTKTGTTILTNISKGDLSSIPATLKVLDQILIDIVFTASDTLTSFSVTMQNKQSDRYGADVGITNVTGLETRLTNIESKNTSQDTAINGKVDKVTGKALSTNDFTNTYKNKIDGLSTVATSGSYSDLSNKPTIPSKTSDLTNDGADGTNVFVANNDSRLTNSRTPTSHTHGNISNAGAIGSASGKIITTTTNGKLQASDSITKSKISDFSHTHGNITNDGKVGSTANLPLITTTDGAITTSTFGTGANTFCQGNDSRLSNARTPTSHTHGSLANGGTLNSDITTVNKVAVTDSSNNLKTIAKVPFANLNIAKSDITGLGIPASDTNTTYTAGTGLDLTGTSFSVKYGTASGTACAGNDSRLSNARTPTSHTHGNLSNDGKIGGDSGKLVVTGTGGALQTADTITKSKISDFPSTMTPTSHSHGNISNSGAIGSTSGKIITTGENGVLEASSTITKSKISDFPTTMTPTSHSHGNISNSGAIGSTSGKIVVTGTNGVLQGADTITKSKISDFPTTMTPTSHSHGNISNSGAIGSTSGKIITTGENGVLQTSDTITKSKISDFSHTHGAITNAGAIGSTSGKFLTTGSSGTIQATEYFKYTITAPEYNNDGTIVTDTYNVKIDSTIPIECSCKDATGTAVAGKTLTLYKDGASVGTATTDANGVASWNVLCDTWGLIDFNVADSHCQVLVDGWRYVSGSDSSSYAVMRNKNRARFILNGWIQPNSRDTSWSNFGGQAYASTVKPTTYIILTNRQVSAYFRINKDGSIEMRTVTGTLASGTEHYGEIEWSLD